MHKPKRRNAYFKLYLLLSLILAGGALSCCSIKQSKGPNYISGHRPHRSFLYIELVNAAEKCENGLCYEGLYASAGSGFSIAPLGKHHTLAITAGHVCMVPPGSINKSIIATSYGGAKHQVQVIAIHGDTDTCVLAVLNARIPPLEVADDDLNVGDRVMAMGAPLGIHGSSMVAMFDGYFSGPAGNTPYPPSSSGALSLYGYTIPARPGSSGGPILNHRNEVVGMIALAHPSFENFALSPTQQELRAVLKASIKAAREQGR